jgi:hypothetical protein
MSEQPAKVRTTPDWERTEHEWREAVIWECAKSYRGMTSSWPARFFRSL